MKKPSYLLLLVGLIACKSVKTIQVRADNQSNDAILHGLSSMTDVNYGHNPQLAANAWTFNKEPGIIRSLLQFDLSSVPPNAEIIKASLSLYAWDSDTGLGRHSPRSGSNEGLLQRVTSSWDENTVTWNTQPSSTELNQVLLPPSTSPEQNYLDIDVTTLVQDMVNNREASFGFMLKLRTESVYRILNFCSSDHTDATRHPKLNIEYK